MRRVVLLALLALLIPTAALATSVSDFGGVGGFGTGFPGSLTGSPTVGGSLTLGMELATISKNGNTITGALGTITITTGTLSSCGSNLCFTGGSVDIVNNSNATLFAGTFENGTLTVTPCGTGLTCGTISAILPNGTSFSGFLKINATGAVTLSSDTIVTTVPEPGTLGLLGTGLIGLAGVVRRRFHSAA